MSGLLQLLMGASAANPVGQQAYTAAGTYTWTAPFTGIISVVAVGSGADGYGGSLAWKNNIPVIVGTGYTVVVSSAATPATRSSFNDNSVVSAAYTSNRTGDGGGNGGNGFGAGAGGYSGTGGTGGGSGATPTAGNGGGGGGGRSDNGDFYACGGGGGVGLLGEGSNGTPGVIDAQRGFGGSGGEAGSNGDLGGGYGGSGGLYGGTKGDGATASGSARDGAVRIIWGDNRSFPSTNTGNM